MAKGAETRQRIIAQAAPVFNQRGFSGTSMQELTEATGLQKGGIYNHFPSKEALAMAALDYAVELLGSRFREAYAQAPPHAADRLLAILGVFARYMEDTPLAGGCPIINTAVEADDTAPAFRDRARAAMTDLHRLLGSIVKAGVRAGELRPDADPYAIASLATSLMEGALIMSRLYDDPVHLRRASEHLEGYIRALIVDRPGPSDGT